MKVTEMSTEELIIKLCFLYYKETKKADRESQQICKELEKRGICDSNSLYQKFNV